MNAREVLARTDLAALLTELAGEPAGTGARRRWRCPAPDHNDLHPSVTMFTDRKGVERWKCWSDGRSGTAIDAVMTARNLDVSASLKWLQERTGDARPAPSPRPGSREHTVQLSAATKRWAARCEQLLWTPNGAAALEWLHQRQLTDETLRANRIGFDPGRGKLSRPIGLPKWAAVTVCAFDPSGELIFVQARNLDPEAPSKYANPAAAHGQLPPVSFPRAGPSGGPLVVTEGIFDALVAQQAGYRTAALLSTGSVTHPRVATAIAEHASGQPIVIALDGDPAGRAAARQLADRLPTGPVEVHPTPAGHDLTSLAQKKGIPQWHRTRTSPKLTPPHSTSYSNF